MEEMNRMMKKTAEIMIQMNRRINKSKFTLAEAYFRED
jgi:hypothetical protein